MTHDLIVIDIMYLFYRHLYRIRSHEEKYNSHLLSYNGVETARMFFTLKDFETIVNYSSPCHVCVCFDSKTTRKDDSAEYKAKRSRITDADHEAVENTYKLLKKAGFAVLKVDGMEADDLVAAVVKTSKCHYDSVTIFTVDSDIAALVVDNVSVMRYKSSNSNKNGMHNNMLQAHTLINEKTFERCLGNEFGVSMPFNSIILYKCTVGDKSDNIKGISGFGVSAYGKMISELNGHVNMRTLNEPENVEKVLRYYFKDSDKLNQAIESLSLVRSRTSRELESAISEIDLRYVSKDSRRDAYMQYGMKIV